MIHSFVMTLKDWNKNDVELIVRYKVTREDVSVIDHNSVSNEKMDQLHLLKESLSATQNGVFYEIIEEDFEEWELDIWKEIERDFTKTRWAA